MIRQPLFLSLLTIGLGLLALTTEVTAADGNPPDKVRFNRDIRPIFSDTCFHCHGFDPKSRKAGLRLDIRDEALKKTENDVYPIVPGKPDESEIVKRLFSTDPDDIMPPPKAHKEIPLAQRELIKRWVAEGAVYEPHWAYAPLTKPPVPKIDSDQFPVGNAIDGFIREKLAEKKIAPSLEAPKARLLRRLSLDLIGLPPTEKEVAAFLADESPNAYEKQVNRLLASPRYGERMAVWWLDIARYTDTVGFHGDQNQRIFPYRDYVINAFNSNKHFDQFTIEQLAGDLLPDPTPEQLVATGYNRLNMMTREGGAQPNEYLAKYGAERVRSVAAAWFGSTFGCAECHDHKFDPIKTRDFYELKSFFADVKQWGVYSDYGYTKNSELAGFTNEYPFPPEILVDSPYLQADYEKAKAALNAHLRNEQPKVVADDKLRADFEKWIEESRDFPHLIDAPGHEDGWKIYPLTALLYKNGKPDLDNDVPLESGELARLEKPLGKDDDLRITVHPNGDRIATIGIQLTPEGADAAASFGKNVKISASVKSADGKTRKLAMYFGDSATKAPLYSSGAEVIGTTADWKLPRQETNNLNAVWFLDPPVKLAPKDKLILTVTGDSPLPLRFFFSPFAGHDPVSFDGPALARALNANPEARTPEQQALLVKTWLLSTATDRVAFNRYKELAAALRETRDGKAWSMVTQAVEPFTVRVLPRGNWQDETGPVVLPATPSFLPGREESTDSHRLTRLDLAQWIVSNENPITARAVMNRLWQQFFGTGLSAAIDDLGSQGELPSHPELLDWIASEFRESGWDMKHMIKLIVMSATYRQSSVLRPELRDVDPTNRLLASQSPRRLQAEFVRDNALSIAGILNVSRIGGPSIKPYQPTGYYDLLQFPNRDYVASTGPEQWRRGVYMHWQRTFLHPMLANFDAPARDECAAVRVVSNTPQQALTLLNDPTFVEAARLFAGRLMSTDAADDAARIDHAFQIAVARPPKDKEMESLEKFLATQRDYYREHADDAAKLLKIGSAPPTKGDPAELAAWASLCRVLLNSQEAITRY
ncbi:MAG TPA: PSD1 and planctomycete cytochrome C domain-containing protein [Chthoniobacter sp.]|nr:PSD1 and planctomycete cytochrome C domain-containing protein [Chthoniobacter sp.]